MYLKFLKALYCISLGGLIILGSCLNLDAQTRQLTFTHIGDEQGLSNNSVETIFQDSRGFIWFGTLDGLNRYDGSSIKIYRNDPDNKQGLSDNHIRSIFEDSRHRLWVATADGLNLFDAVADRFTRYRHNLPYTTLNGDKINHIFQYQDGFLWLCTAWGALSEFEISTGKFTDYFYDGIQSPAENKNVYDVAVRKPNEVWVGTQNGLKVFDLKKKRFTDSDNPYQASFPFKVVKTCIAANQVLWLGTEENGLYRVDQIKKRIDHFLHDEKRPGSLRNNRIVSMLIDKNNRLFVGTVNGGLNIFDNTRETFTNYTNNPALKGSLSQRSVNAIFEDNQRNLWVGTPRGGVNMASLIKEKFELYRNGLNKNSLSYNDVKSFCEDAKGNLWIGTDGGGLNYYDKSAGTFKSFRFDAHNNRSLGSDQVMALCTDHTGKVWAGTFDGGLNLFNNKTQDFKRYLHHPGDTASLASNMVESVMEDHLHRLWVCTYNGGLDLFNPVKGNFRHIGRGNTPETQLMGIKLISSKEDHTGNLWIVTVDEGLNCYNPGTGRFRHYFRGNNHSDLNVVFIDHTGRIWAGKKGLYLYNPQKDNFFLFSKTSQLKGAYIKDIEEGRPGEFWISTSNGLIQYDTRQDRLKTYNTHDGLQGSEFEFNSGLKAKNGKIYFGGTNGFNAFVPDSITANTFIPRVYLTDFQIFNEHVEPGIHSVLRQDISYAKTIALDYRQTSISFDFAALNFVKSENNSYAYKLENFDSKWNYMGHVHHAAYTNLDPGDYIFKVKAANNDGVWNPQETSLHIVISPPFWKTWWFMAIVCAGIGITVYFLYEFKRKLDLNALLERQKEETHQQQLQFFTNISHEFRTPLSLILGPLETIRQKNNALQNNRYLQTIEKSALRLMRLVNELMDFRKLQSGAVRLQVKEHASFDLFREIADEFDSIAAQKLITFQINFEAPDQPMWFDEQIVEKIVYNLLNNAFKYTDPGGLVKFDILFAPENDQNTYSNKLVFKHKTRSSDYFLIRIRDNGIGISADSIRHIFERYYRVSTGHLGSGIGLAFVKSLTELQRGDIFVYSEHQTGTEFLIALPYRQEDYNADELWNGNKLTAHVQLESVYDRHEDLISDAPEATISDFGEKKERILLVDDNNELRAFLKDSLGNHYAISEAQHGEEALIMTKSVYPDLIISDVMMPVMDGNDFCNLIKNDIETSHIPFVMLTARDAVEAKIEGTLSGADVYLTKPFSIQMLLATVSNIFEQQKKLKEHYLKDYFSEAKELVHNQKDRDFMAKLMAIIGKQLSNPDLDVEQLSREMGMSQSRLYQKIKKISGQSIVEFIRSCRLKKAIQIMTHEDVTINEIIFRVGIQTPSYFTKSFKKEFGKTPSQFLHDIRVSS
jgi:signal transduction histidine kinase/ligand-binding sensor domain-containing protein/DNA-binding response OmpR family regulator